MLTMLFINVYINTKTQIDCHVSSQYLNKKIPYVCEFDLGSTELVLDPFQVVTRIQDTHAPFVFIDKATTVPLPPPDFLAMFPIVITTTARLSSEWKNGSFEREIKRKTLDDDFEEPDVDEWVKGWYSSCSLLKVHWLRMVVDEGHSMGRDRNNNGTQFTSWISSERRWAMTGTPTKRKSNELTQLQNLFSFLRHDFFTGKSGGDKFWNYHISKGWKDGRLSSFFRLRSLASFLMKRQTKLDMTQLAPPIYRRQAIQMSFTEVTTYNTLVAAVQSNIFLTTHKGSKTSGERDSLLNPKNARYAREALANIRGACVGYARVVPVLKHRFYLETITMAKTEIKLPAETVDNIKKYLHYAENEGLTECACCHLELTTLLLLPCCGSLLCSECVEKDSTICPVCGNTFDVDVMQRLQPGFDNQWRDNIEAAQRDIGIKLEYDNGTLPAIAGRALVNPDAIVRPPIMRQRSKRPGDGHACCYDSYAPDGKCTLCLKEHNSCLLINGKSRCSVCGRCAIDTDEAESKCHYLVNKILHLYLEREKATTSKPPIKIIVYSQFRKALNLVGDRMLRRYGNVCVAEYWGCHRRTELHKFAE
jgi:SNF2 family DNA or RNA helicase